MLSVLDTTVRTTYKRQQPTCCCCFSYTCTMRDTWYNGKQQQRKEQKEKKDEDFHQCSTTRSFLKTNEYGRQEFSDIFLRPIYGLPWIISADGWMHTQQTA